MNFVLDSSVTLAWVFEDEATDFTNALRRSFGEGARASVPGLWRWEIGNALLTALRRKRMTSQCLQQHLMLLESLPIDNEGNAFNQLWGRTLALAENHQLTLYDATYLELAIRLSLPLATFDEALRRAAVAEKVTLLPERV